MQIFHRHLPLWVPVKMFSFYQTNEVRQKGKEKGLASIFSRSKQSWHTTEAIWRWACIIHANAPAECANAAERGGFIRFGFHFISCVYLHGRSDVTWHFRLQFRGNFLQLASCIQQRKRHLCTSISPIAPPKQLTAGPGGSPCTSPHPHSAVSLFNMADSLFFLWRHCDWQRTIQAHIAPVPLRETARWSTIHGRGNYWETWVLTKASLKSEKNGGDEINVHFYQLLKNRTDDV